MNMEGYVPVNDRLIEALKRWPDLRVQETAFDIQKIEEQVFLICEITVWRTPDDPKPSIGSVAEPFPGRTPYTRNSERAVGFTSALGRALGYMGIGIDKAMASANEVQARQDKPDRPPSGTVEPTEAQIRMLRSLNYKGDRPRTKKEASEIIDAIKEKRIESGEDPF